MKRQLTGKNTKQSYRPRKGDRQKDFLTPKEVAYASGIGQIAIYSFLKEGLLKSVRVGKAHYIPRPEYQRWLHQFTRTDAA